MRYVYLLALIFALSSLVGAFMGGLEFLIWSAVNWMDLGKEPRPGEDLDRF